MEIVHRGEKLTIKVDKRHGNKTRMIFDGPLSFDIQRVEAGRTARRQPIESGGPCFVQVHVNGASMQADILSYENRDGIESYSVKLANGEVMRRVPANQVQMIEKESGESFENDRPESDR